MLDLEMILPYYMVVIILLLIGYLLFKYINNVSKQPPYIKYILIFLRFSSVFLIILILLNPVLIINKKNVKNKKIIFYIDNSKSMLSSISEYDLIDKLNETNIFLNENNIDFDYYVFSDTLNKIKSISNIKFDGLSTNINYVTQSINKIIADKYIVISDGMQNQGLVETKGIKTRSIYSFGVGENNAISEDVKIDSLILMDSNKDSIYIKCQISSTALNDYNDVEINLTNQKYNNIKISNINIKKGKDIFFHNIRVSKNILENNNIISIETIDLESDLNNNYLNLQLEDKELQKYSGLLISGSLSNNTKFIKRLLNDNQNISFEHIFKPTDILDIKFKDYDFLIFDSFPIDNEQIKVIENQALDSKKIIYFQGPIKSGNIFNKQFLSKFGYNLKILDDDDYKTEKIYLESIISDNKLINGFVDGIVPFESSLLVKNNNSESSDFIFNKLNRESIILDYTNNALFVFIPDLKTLSSNTKRFNDIDNLSYLIDHYINKILRENKLLELYTNKSRIYIDGDMKIYIDINNKDYFNNSLINLFIYDKNYSLVSKVDKFDNINNNLYEYSFITDIPQKFYAKATLKTDNDITIDSDMIEFNVLDIDSELSNIGLNEHILRTISFDTKGEYYNFSELLDYVMKIDSSQLVTLNLESTKIFNFQLFWFIILLLMILEWFIRKNRGLL